MAQLFEAARVNANWNTTMPLDIPSSTSWYGPLSQESAGGIVIPGVGSYPRDDIVLPGLHMHEGCKKFVFGGFIQDVNGQDSCALSLSSARYG
jgi:hypothetical protein